MRRFELAQPITKYGDIEYDACADFDRDLDVDGNDLNILQTWFEVSDVPNDCPLLDLPAFQY